MNKILILLLSIWLIVPILQAQEDLSQYEKRSFKSSTGLELPYRLLMPKDFDKGEFYPLIVFLHGAGERGNDNEAQLIHGSNVFLNEVTRTNYPAIVIFPQCRAESFWATISVDRSKTPRVFNFNYDTTMTEDLRAVTELIGKLRSTYRIHEKQIFVAGLSMGGMGTFEIVYRNPDLFAAAMPICGGGNPESYLNNFKGKTKFWLFHGDADPVVSVEESRKMKKSLEQLKIPLRYIEYPGVGHDSWTNAFAEKEFISWLFARE